MRRKLWFGWVTAIVFAGFLASAALFVLAGVVEGAILGAAQWFVLRRTIPALSARRWIGVTALAAGFAWSVASVVVGNSGRINALPVPLLLTVIAVAGTSILLAPGIGQCWCCVTTFATRSSGSGPTPWRGVRG